MIALRVSEVARALGARWSGEDVGFVGCAIDSRALPPGALFVALRGVRADGHAFVRDARARGAVAVLAERDIEADLPTIRVADTRLALGELAALWRRRHVCPLVGVTGSNGKTTVKEMLAAVLRQVAPTLATEGNLNNDLGVPLTLCRLGAEHRFAVVEMGANHPGEIARLASLARPTVGVITQCAPAHLEGFGSVAGVARAKGELIEGLPAADGVAVLNRDDPHLALWAGLAGARRVLTFGLEGPADVTARWAPEGVASRIALKTPLGEVELSLPLPGRHNVMNALAVAAAATALGVPLEAVRAGLESVRAARGRLEVKQAGQARVLDDTYNANPGSVAAALGVLAGLPAPRWLVLGDMGELGAGAEGYHREVGTLARRAGVERLYAVGPLARLAVEAFGTGARHFPDHAALAAAVEADLRTPATVLVKGSRSMTMERVVDALVGGG